MVPSGAFGPLTITTVTGLSSLSVSVSGFPAGYAFSWEEMRNWQVHLQDATGSHVQRRRMFTGVLVGPTLGIGLDEPLFTLPDLTWAVYLIPSAPEIGIAAVGSVTGPVGSVVAPVTVGPINPANIPPVAANQVDAGGVGVVSGERDCVILPGQLLATEGCRVVLIDSNGYQRSAKIADNVYSSASDTTMLLFREPLAVAPDATWTLRGTYIA